MVQSPENWADLSGRIIQFDEQPDASGLVRVDLQVDEAKPVPGFANLFAWAPGQTVAVRLPQDQASGLALAAGMRLECRVQKSGPQNVLASGEHLHVV